jgi:serine/threonine protein kinase
MDCMRDKFYDGVVLDGRFQTISPLNHGSFGMVFMARDLTTNDLVAVKCLTKKSATDDTVSVFAVDEKSEELACHTRLGSHSNIVNLIHNFETDAHIYLVLEFCSRGDLYEAIRTGCGPLETEHVREFMLQLVDAVAYIHSKGMHHRDIKPENIFLTNDGTLKLGDFGLATKDTWSYETTVGSDRYMAPEQYDSAGAGYSPAQADIWAIGICLLNVLFSRNPFTTPTEEDPLFLDFSRDRQSLFDVFPMMSQDTFEVITHSMSLDPRKRSLANVRESLLRVVSFTTFDESLDDFCTASRPNVASANREPLRTPSIQSPQVEQGSFPWAKALHASPPQAIRQLSIIPDTESYDEDLFPSSEESNKDWFSVGAHTPSMSSLGASMNSLAIRRLTKKSLPSRADLAPISGSLPISMIKSKPIPSMASVFGRQHDMVSKSWSDLWDEEEEEEEQHEKDLKERQALNSRTWSHESKADDVEVDVTPRREGLSEPKSSSFVNTRSRSPETARTTIIDIDHDIVNDGFFFQDAVEPPQASPPRYSPPSKRTTFDKWAALGDRRRAASTSQEKSPYISPGRNNNLGMGSSTIIKASAYATGGFTGFGAGVWDIGGKANVSNNNMSSGRARECPWARARDHTTQQHYRKEKSSDLGDLEWVGGWNDLQL